MHVVPLNFKQSLSSADALTEPGGNSALFDVFMQTGTPNGVVPQNLTQEDSILVIPEVLENSDVAKNSNNASEIAATDAALTLPQSDVDFPSAEKIDLTQVLSIKKSENKHDGLKEASGALLLMPLTLSMAPSIKPAEKKQQSSTEAEAIAGMTMVLTTPMLQEHEVKLKRIESEAIKALNAQTHTRSLDASVDMHDLEMPNLDMKTQKDSADLRVIQEALLEEQGAKLRRIESEAIKELKAQAHTRSLEARVDMHDLEMPNLDMKTQKNSDDLRLIQESLPGLSAAVLKQANVREGEGAGFSVSGIGANQSNPGVNGTEHGPSSLYLDVGMPNIPTELTAALDAHPADELMVTSSVVETPIISAITPQAQLASINLMNREIVLPQLNKRLVSGDDETLIDASLLEISDAPETATHLNEVLDIREDADVPGEAMQYGTERDIDSVEFKEKGMPFQGSHNAEIDKTVNEATDAIEAVVGSKPSADLVGETALSNKHDGIVPIDSMSTASARDASTAVAGHMTVSQHQTMQPVLTRMAKAINDNKLETLKINLTPDHLGNVEVILEKNDSGTLFAMLNFEKSEALAWFQTHRDELMATLKTVGFEGENIAMGLSAGGEQQRESDGRSRDQQWEERTPLKSEHAANTAKAYEAPTVITHGYNSRKAQRHLNIKA